MYHSPRCPATTSAESTGPATGTRLAMFLLCALCCFNPLAMLAPSTTVDMPRYLTGNLSEDIRGRGEGISNMMYLFTYVCMYVWTCRGSHSRVTGSCLNYL